MRTASIILAALAITIPAAIATFDFGTFTIGGTTAAASGTAGSGLAITGLSAASATLAGFGGLLLAVKAGGFLGLLAARATRRGKRSIVNRSIATEEEIGEQFIFDAVASMDAADCGKRYLCEVAATPIQQLEQEELTSLLLFQSAPGAPGSGKAAFDEAVRFGAVHRSHQACQVRYSSCPNAADSHDFLSNHL